MRNCLILGSGRCGTSALAGALAKTGVFTGFHPVGVSSQMPNGYWEDHRLCDWNNKLLEQCCDYKGILILPIPMEAHERMPKATHPQYWDARRYFWFQPYALKDPRFTYTYRAWKPMFAQPHVNIVLFRNPCDFADSARRLRADHPVVAHEQDRLEEMWSNAYQHALANDDGTFCYLEFDELMDGSANSYLEALLGYKIRWDFIQKGITHITNAKCPEKLWPLYQELRSRAANRDRLLADMA